jgi:quercetin dioxygenase-like cupin family protein
VLLATYRLRPGCSEGLHTHGLDDAQCGTFNGFCYIVSGCGELTIGDRIVPVSNGDYVYIASGVSRGIANTSAEEDLRVHIVAIPAAKR